MKYLFLATLSIVAILLAPTGAAAQHRVSGTVTDAQTGEALVGVNVIANGTTLGTTTDEKGHYELSSRVTLGSLTFSFIGYLSTTRPVGSLSSIDVRLSPSSVDLQPVVVSASRGAQSRTEAPIAIDVLSAKQLEESKPTMIFQALNQVPGVHMANLGNEQHNMSIRQPLEYRALFVYMEDGMPIRPTGVFNHNALIEINMAAVGRVEVIRGPSSALYGSNAVGGAVNFITPSPTHEPSGYVNLRTDNYGYRRADVNASSTFGKLGIFVGGYGARQRDSWAEHTDFDKLSLTLRADYDFSDRTRLMTTVSTNHLDTDMRGSLDSLNFYGKGYSSLQTFTYRKVSATRVRSSLSHVWDARNASTFSVAFRDNTIGQLPSYRVSNDRTNPLRATGEINEIGFRSVVADLQHRHYFGAMDAVLTAGATLDNSPGDYFARFLEIERNDDGQYVGFTDVDSLLTDYNIGLLNVGSFAQFEFVPVNRLRIVAALRYDRIDYDYDNHLPVSAFSGAPDETNGYNRLSPKIGFTYDLGRGRGVYANASQGFIPPEVGELYRGVKVPTLKSSAFNSYEVGGWTTLVDGRLYLNAAAYHMGGRNEVVSVRLDDGTTENRNAGKTKHRGVEYAVAIEATRELSFRLGGTNAVHEYVEFQDAGTSFDGNEMALAPDWIANAEITYRPSFLPGARLGVEWQHLGGYFMDPQNTQEYGGYDLVNVRLGYRIGGVEVWANVENVTDELYANTAAKSRWGHSFSPGASRNAVFGVGYNFGRR